MPYFVDCRLKQLKDSDCKLTENKNLTKGDKIRNITFTQF